MSCDNTSMPSTPSTERRRYLLALLASNAATATALTSGAIAVATGVRPVAMVGGVVAIVGGLVIAGLFAFAPTPRREAP